MDTKAIASLRDMLLNLPATGADGFEGLLAAVLAEISGVPFRLSGSGSQFGMDGKSAYEDDAICFEAKRYDGKIRGTKSSPRLPNCRSPARATSIFGCWARRPP